MLFNVGDYVTRESYNNDTVFKIIEIKDSIAILQGVNIRLIADSNISDLVLCEKCKEDLETDDSKLLERMDSFNKLNRDEYFYLPGKVLHIDADKEYLDRCMNFYKKMNVLSYGIVMKEKDVSSNIYKYLNEIKPDILVVTGHDAYNSKDYDDYKNNNNYKNSMNFINAVRNARKYEKDQEKLIIIAGACQSNYEELIKSGANFASSPKRINIHALDPAIIASTIALTKTDTQINVPELLEKTKYGSNGMGGIITNGLMYVGYPR